MGLGAISVMADRNRVIDYTVPYYDTVGITILMKKVKEKTDIFLFIGVCENEVWVCLFGSLFLTVFLLWAFDRYCIMMILLIMFCRLKYINF